jgi:parallel beta-helix repeat protein
VPIGGTIFLKAGYYALAGAATITKPVNIIGEGMGKTIILTADAHGFWIEDVDYIIIKNLTIDGDAQTTDGTTYRACIASNGMDYILFENIEAKNAARYGIDCNTMNHSSLLNIYTHDNYRHGIHSGTTVVGTANDTYNTYRDIYCWNNGVDGFDNAASDNDCIGSNNVYDNIQAWDNGEIGIAIYFQNGGVISNSSANGNGIRGLSLWFVDNFNIHDCSVTLSEEWGIYLWYSNNNNFTNVIVKNNNTANGSAGGIMVRESNGIRFTSCQSYDDRVTPLQDWGLMTEDAVDYIELVNCKLSPNLSGEIYNGASPLAVITGEIKLARL